MFTGNSSDDQRGAFSSLRVIDGNLNEDVSANGSNFPADSFKNAYTGSLVIEVNGTEIQTANLVSSTSTISSVNANGTGFSLSALGFRKHLMGYLTIRKTTEQVHIPLVQQTKETVGTMLE